MSRRILVIPLALSLVVSSGLAAPTPTTPTPVPAPLCDGRLATIFGLSGQIKGTKGPDVIVGSPQPDVILGSGGADRICGGDGNDTIDGGSGNDRLFGEYGDDLVKGGPGHDVISDLEFGAVACLYDGPGATVCVADQRLEGGDGDDKVSGVGILRGDAGDDAIALSFGDADGGPDNDFLRTSTFATFDDGPIFRGGDGNDVIDADSGTDSALTDVYGDSGTDTCITDADDFESGCEL